MKNISSFGSRFLAVSALAFALAAPLISSSAFASTGSWITNASANWNTTTVGVWSGGIVPQNAGDIAYFTSAITGNVTVTLNSSETIGAAYFGTGDNKTFTIGPGTSTALTFSNTNSADSIISVNAGSAGDTISAPVVIGGDGVLDFSNASLNTFTISGAISQTASPGTINVGGGSLTLSGSNTFTGGVTITSGSLTVSNATGAGTGTITAGAASDSANASALFSGPTVANLITVPTGYTGTPSIGLGVNAAASTLSGTLALAETTNLVNLTGGVPAAPRITVSALISGTGGINVVSPLFGQLSSSGQTYGTMGQADDQVYLSNLGNTYSGDTQILSGDLVICGTAASNGSVNLNSLLGTSTDPIFIGGATGVLDARLTIVSAVSATTGTNVAATLSRAITTQAGGAGYAMIQTPNASAEYVGALPSTQPKFSGTITLNKSLYVDGEVTGVAVTGPIAPGSGAIGGVGLLLDGFYASGGPNGKGDYGVNLTGSNSYNGGTVVYEPSAGNAAYSLGTGNVVVESGFLHLGATNALASSKTVLVETGAVLEFGANFSQNQMQAAIDPASVGGVSVYGLTAGTYVNLAPLGSGSMYLCALPYSQVDGGTSVDSYSYTSGSLGANSDGNYRLGMGSPPSNANQDGIITFTKSVFADTIKGPAQVITGFGSIVLAGSNNTYTGGTVVNFELSGSASSVAGQSPFGSGPMTINDACFNGTGGLWLGGPAVSTLTNMGNLTFNGAAEIGTSVAAGGTNTIQTTSFVRGTYGTLYLNLAGNTYVTGSSVGAAPATIPINTTYTASTLAPAYYYNASGFMTYVAGTGTGTGFFSATPGLTQGAGTLTLQGTDTYVSITGTISSLTASGTASAMTIAGNTVTLGAGKILTITNSSGYAGLFSAGGTVTGGNLNFGSCEGIIATNSGLTISSGIQGTGGITKTGYGGLTLTVSNSFTGQFALDCGTVTIGNDNELGSAAAGSAAGLYFNGGGLALAATSSFATSVNRTMTIGALGGYINENVSEVLTIPGPITGAGPFSLTVSTTGTSTVILSNTTNNFSGPLTVGYRTTLQIDNAAELGSGNNAVLLSGGDANLLYTGTTSTSTARGLGFLDMGGAVDTSSTLGTLTVNGPISGTGLFLKNGLGTLVLTGSGSETGNVAVNAGILNIQNSYALGASDAVVTGSIGISGGPAFVENGATLEMQGGIAIGSKTLYLNGTGVGGIGALTNVGGSNSTAGAVVLQAATSIASQSGTLTLSGPVMGSAGLTVVGPGTVQLGGTSPGFTGATTVQSGNLIVSGSLSGTVNVAAGTLNGSGFTGAISGTTGAHVSPGFNNTPAILTAPQVAGGTGLTFDFALTQATPNTTSTNSGNDLLSLTSATPFTTGSLTAGNTVNIYLANFTPGNTYQGGFLITTTAEGTNDLLADLGNATINYYLAGTGSTTFDGISTYGILSNPSGTINLTDVAVTGGEELEITAVPEPETWGMLAAGFGVLGLVFRARRVRSRK